MRICVLSKVADRSERALVKGLAERGHSITYVAEARDPVLDERGQAGMRVHTADFRRKFDRSCARDLKEIFLQGRFDLVYATGSRTLTTGLLAARGTTLPFITYRGHLGRVSYLNPLNRLAQLNSRVQRIIVNSAAIRNALIDCRVPADRIAVVYKGYAREWYAGARPIRRDEHGIPDDQFLIGCVANFRPDKGGETLLQALALIPPEIPIHLALVGEIQDRAILRTIRRLGLRDRVTMTGYRDDALDWTAGFDLSVMPSKRESFSRAIVESIAIGTPVIVTAVGGMPELVLDGRTGIVVEPSNPAALAAAIMEAYRNPARMRSFAEAGRQHLADRFSVDRYVQDMERVFGEVCLENQRKGKKMNEDR